MQIWFISHSATHATQHCPPLLNFNDVPCLQYVLSSAKFFQGSKAPQWAHQCQRVACPGQADHRVIQDQHDVLCLSRQVLFCVLHYVYNYMHLGSLGNFTLLYEVLFILYICRNLWRIVLVKENISKCSNYQIKSIQCMVLLRVKALVHHRDIVHRIMDKCKL